MANTELVSGNVHTGEHYVVIARRRPDIAVRPDIAERLGDEIGSYRWSHDHLTRMHGVAADAIERDILGARIPGAALGERHWNDHEGPGSRLPVPHCHIEEPEHVKALYTLRDLLRALGCEPCDGPGGFALDLVERLLTVVSV